jgi:hypothetical protein
LIQPERYRLGVLRAEDEEYSEIQLLGVRMNRPVRTWYTVAVRVPFPYLDGALMDAPASARSDKSDPADKAASTAMIVKRVLRIAPSSWFDAMLN